MPFRIAVAVSVLIHSALFIPMYKTFTMNKETRAAEAMVVGYVTTGEAESAQNPGPVKAADSKDAISGVHPKENVISAKREARKLIREQAVLRTSKGYINYYQLIRETIRQRLKNYYKTVNAKGDVALTFILTSNGTLAAIDVDDSKSVRDPSLIQITMKSVKESSPFPPFPKELSVPKMSFDLTISFKNEIASAPRASQ